MRRAALGRRWFGAPLIAVLIGGCGVTVSGDVVDSGRGMVERTVAGVEAAGVDDLRRRVTSAPVPCAHQDGYQASFTAAGFRSDGTDPQALLDAIRARWEELGLTVDEVDQGDEFPALRATADDGTIHDASVLTARSAPLVSLRATTDCVGLPDGYEDASSLREEFHNMVDPGGERFDRDLDDPPPGGWNAVPVTAVATATVPGHRHRPGSPSWPPPPPAALAPTRAPSGGGAALDPHQ